MRLLVCAQKVGRDDPVLGFFHRWVEELAAHFGQVTVLCLREGEHALPPNVRVVPLGTGRATRLFRLLRHSVVHRGEYDAVFVHMSQEFVLAGGWLWRLLGKQIYLWRNHYHGSFLTDLAALFCTKVFYTSKFSYTAKYKKAILMPVGIDTGLFKLVPGAARDPRSVLFLARMAPSKRPTILIDALAALREEGVDFSAAFYGSPLPQDAAYFERLKESAESLPIEFHPAVPNYKTPEIYNRYGIFVNCSPSGMLDKTIFEAAACGCVTLAASEDWRVLAGEEFWFNDATTLAQRLKQYLKSGGEGRDVADTLVERHSLDTLGKKLMQEIKIQHHV